MLTLILAPLFASPGLPLQPWRVCASSLIWLVPGTIDVAHPTKCWFVPFSFLNSAETAKVQMRCYHIPALVISEFRRCGFTTKAPGPATRLTVTLTVPGPRRTSWSHPLRGSRGERKQQVNAEGASVPGHLGVLSQPVQQSIQFFKLSRFHIVTPYEVLAEYTIAHQPTAENGLVEVKVPDLAVK